MDAHDKTPTLRFHLTLWTAPPVPDLGLGPMSLPEKIPIVEIDIDSGHGFIHISMFRPFRIVDVEIQDRRPNPDFLNIS